MLKNEDVAICNKCYYSNVTKTIQGVLPKKKGGDLMIRKAILYVLIDNQNSNKERIFSLCKEVKDYCKEEGMEVLRTFFCEDDIKSPIENSSFDSKVIDYALNEEGVELILIHDKPQYPEIQQWINLGPIAEYDGFNISTSFNNEKKIGKNAVAYFSYLDDREKESILNYNDNICCIENFELKKIYKDKQGQPLIEKIQFKHEIAVNSEIDIIINFDNETRHFAVNVLSRN